MEHWLSISFTVFYVCDVPVNFHSVNFYSLFFPYLVSFCFVLGSFQPVCMHQESSVWWQLLWKHTKYKKISCRVMPCKGTAVSVNGFCDRSVSYKMFPLLCFKLSGERIRHSLGLLLRRNQPLLGKYLDQRRSRFSTLSLWPSPSGTERVPFNFQSLRNSPHPTNSRLLAFLFLPPNNAIRSGLRKMNLAWCSAS